MGPLSSSLVPDPPLSHNDQNNPTPSGTSIRDHRSTDMGGQWHSQQPAGAASALDLANILALILGGQSSGQKQQAISSNGPDRVNNDPSGTVVITTQLTPIPMMVLLSLLQARHTRSRVTALWQSLHLSLPQCRTVKS